MPNSVRPIPKPPRAKARSPAGNALVFCFVTMTSSLLSDAQMGNIPRHRQIRDKRCIVVRIHPLMFANRNADPSRSTAPSPGQATHRSIDI